MTRQHSPRHAAGPAVGDAPGRAGLPARGKRWILVAAAGACLVVMGSAALGGLTLDGLFRADVATTVRPGSSPQPDPDTRPWSTTGPTGPTSTATVTGASPDPEDTTNPPGQTGTDATTPVPRTTSTAPEPGPPGSSTPTPDPTASATEPGKSGTAPGQTKRPKPTPKP